MWPAVVAADARAMNGNVTERDLLSTLRRTIGSLVVLGLVVVVVGCLAMGISDASSHEDEFDGLGVFIAALVGVPALVGLALEALALWLDSRRPFAARVITAFVAVAVGALGVAMTVSVGAWALLLVVVGVVHLLTAVVPAEQRDDAV
jgi:hypothetical protein